MSITYKFNCKTFKLCNISTFTNFLRLTVKLKAEKLFTAYRLIKKYSKEKEKVQKKNQNA